MILLAAGGLRAVRGVYMQAIDIIRNRVCGKCGACAPHTPLCACAPPWGRAPRLETKVKGISLDVQKDLRWLAELIGGPATVGGR